MVSKASEDLPEPDSPVKTISFSRGSSRLTLRRLCSRAPRTTSESATTSEAIASAHPRNACSIGVGGPYATWRMTRYPASTHAGSDARLAQLALELVDLVAQASGVFEAQVGGGLVHLPLGLREGAPRRGGGRGGRRGAPPRGGPGRAAPPPAAGYGRTLG